MPQSTYRDQFQLLVDKGYLVANSSNGFDFFEVPQTRGAHIQSEEHAARGIDFENATNDGFSQTPTVQTDTAEDREINNIDNTINTSINNELYPQRVVRIPSPIAEGKKRPQEKPQEPKKEFVF